MALQIEERPEAETPDLGAQESAADSPYMKPVGSGGNYQQYADANNLENRESSIGPTASFGNFDPKIGKSGDKAKNTIGSAGVSDAAGLAPSLTEGLPIKNIGDALTPEGKLKNLKKAAEFAKEHKKGMGIGTGVVTVIIFGFSTFGTIVIGNELNTIVTNAINKFLGIATHDVTKEADKELQNYIRNRIIKRLGPGCEDAATMSQECKDKVKGPTDATAETDPVNKLYDAWDQDDLMGKLSNAGIDFKDVNGKTHMFADGLPAEGIDITDALANEEDIFNIDGLSQEVKDRLSNIVAELMPADGVMKHQELPEIEAKKGIDFCVGVTGCDPENNNGDQATETDAEMAETADQIAYEETALDGSIVADGMQCLLDTACTPDQHTNYDPATGSDTSDLEEKFAHDGAQVLLAIKLQKVSDVFLKLQNLKGKGSDATVQVLADALSAITGTDISKDATDQAISQISESLAGPVKWIQFAAIIVSDLSGAKNKLEVINYAVHEGPAILDAAKTAAALAEQKSGGNHISLLEVGSIVKSYTNAGGTSMTQSQWYQKTTDPQNTPSDVTSSSIGQELGAEKLGPLNHYSNFLAQASGGFNSIPGAGFLTDLASLVNSIVNGVLAPINGIISGFAGVTGLNDLIGKGAVVLIRFMVSELVAMPDLTSLDGRTHYDLFSEGFDHMGSGLAEANGGGKLSAVGYTNINNEQQQVFLHQFQQKPLFARLFSTDTPYSLVSRLSLNFPSSFAIGLQDTTMSLFTNPFSKVFHGFSTLFTSNIVHADTIETDPAGITQYGFQDSDPVFATDPEQYWQQHNCAQEEAQGWPTWNSSANTQINPDTGQVEHLTTNGCLLIVNSAKAAGALAGYTGS